MNKFDNVKDFFSFMIDVPSVAWRFHLSTDSYSEHMALDDFYDEMQELVDSLIEAYQGKFEKFGYIEPVEYEVGKDAVSFLEGLLDTISDIEDKETVFVENDELQSDIDDIVSLIDSTLYKLKNLK